MQRQRGQKNLAAESNASVTPSCESPKYHQHYPSAGTQQTQTLKRGLDLLNHLWHALRRLHLLLCLNCPLSCSLTVNISTELLYDVCSVSAFLHTDSLTHFTRCRFVWESVGCGFSGILPRRLVAWDEICFDVRGTEAWCQNYWENFPWILQKLIDNWHDITKQGRTSWSERFENLEGE